MLKIDFLKYSVKDFLMDDSFQQWVCREYPEPYSALASWMEEHPEKREVVEEARRVMLQLRSHFEGDTSSYEIDEVWSDIQTTIGNALTKHEYKM